MQATYTHKEKSGSSFISIYHAVGGLCLACSLALYSCCSLASEVFKKLTEYTIIFVADVLVRFGTGVWMYCIGLPNLGIAMCLCSVLPSWPFAVIDATRFKWGRCLLAFLGCHHLLEYEGMAASPEMELVATVLGAVPAMSVVAMAGVEGRDVLLTGGGENDFTKMWMAMVAMLAGFSVSRSTAECVEAGKRPRKSVSANALARLERKVSGAIDGILERGFHTFVHAIDAVTLVAVVGLVGGLYDNKQFLLWCLSFWSLCGLLPACAAPPPMPTLRDSSGLAVPMEGLAFVGHRLAVGLLLTACPPISYLEQLESQKRLTWALAALFRSVFLVTSAMVAKVQQQLGFVFAALMTVGAFQTAVSAGGMLLLTARRDRMRLEKLRDASRRLLQVDDESPGTPAMATSASGKPRETRVSFVSF